MEAPEQGLEESFHRGNVHEPHRDARPVPLSQPQNPLGEDVPFIGQVVWEGALDLLQVHLPSQPGDLPGYLTAPSMLIVGQDVRHDFDANRSFQGITTHWLSSQLNTVIRL